MMAAGDLIFTDYQYEYNGVLFGWETLMDVQELSNFIGYPTVRSSTEDAFGRHGGVPGRHYLPSRTFTMEFNIQGSEDDTEYAATRKLVTSALAPRSHPRDQIEFVYQHPGSAKRFVLARPTDLVINVDRMYALKYPHGTVRFEATDPRHYELETQLAMTGLPDTGGGISFPLVFPLNFGPGLGGGESVVANTGNAPAHWIAEISGPVTNPRLECTNSTGETYFLEINGLSIGVGEKLVFNSKTKAVLLGTQSRRSFLTPQSSWFTLDPYPETCTLRFRSSDIPVTTSTLTFTWHNAYWGD